MKKSKVKLERARVRGAAIVRLAKARAEMKASGYPLRFTWAYIRSNRRDLMDDYILLHPNMPALKGLKAARAKAAKAGR
jgi:hypothetical protein